MNSHKMSMHHTARDADNGYVGISYTIGFFPTRIFIVDTILDFKDSSSGISLIEDII